MLIFSFMEQGSIISQAIRATNREGEPTMKEFYKWYKIENIMNILAMPFV